MLVLYVKKRCPYCIKVTDFTHAHHIPIQERDISHLRNLKELLRKGGKRQVPFLVDNENGICMYESDDIIGYLREKYVREKN